MLRRYIHHFSHRCEHANESARGRRVSNHWSKLALTQRTGCSVQFTRHMCTRCALNEINVNIIKNLQISQMKSNILRIINSSATRFCGFLQRKWEKFYFMIFEECSMRTTTRQTKNIRAYQSRANSVPHVFIARSISSIRMQTHDKPRYMRMQTLRMYIFWFYEFGSKRCTLFILANCSNVCARAKSHKNSWLTAMSARSNHSASNTYKLNGTVSHFRSSVHNIHCARVCCFTHFLNVIYCLNMVPN